MPLPVIQQNVCLGIAGLVVFLLIVIAVMYYKYIYVDVGPYGEEFKKMDEIEKMIDRLQKLIRADINKLSEKDFNTFSDLRNNLEEILVKSADINNSPTILKNSEEINDLIIKLKTEGMGYGDANDTKESLIFTIMPKYDSTPYWNFWERFFALKSRSQVLMSLYLSSERLYSDK